MRLIPRFWVEDVVEHHGEFIDVPPRPVHPKPLQDPHPRLYMACTHADSLVDAGGRGMGALVLGFGGPEQVSGEEPDLPGGVREPGSSASRSVSARTSTLPRSARRSSSRTGSAARRIGIRGQRFFMESIGHWASGGKTPLPRPEEWPLDLTTTTGDGTTVISASIGSERVSVDFSDQQPGAAEPQPRLRHRRRRDRLRHPARRCWRRRDPVPQPDGHRARRRSCSRPSATSVST